MKINLKTAVSRLFPTHSFEMIYIEAVANALDANATEINITIKYKEGEFSEFTIVDNGIGFDEQRYRRFSNLMEVEDASHKGQGRLIYLHYFNDILFESVYKENDATKKIKFNFSYDFEDKKYEPEKTDSQSIGTVISFSGYAKEKVGKIDYLQASSIKELLLSEFLPCIQQLKEQNIPLSINIFSYIDGEPCEESISIDDIPNFTSLTIETELLENISKKLSKEIQTNLFRNPLTLYYSIKNVENKKSIVTSFSIDKRAIKVPIIDKTNYIDGTEAIFFITSQGFDGLVDPTRRELTISKSDLKEIKQIFKNKITEILNENIPIFQENIKTEKTFLNNIFPHLYGYFPVDEIGFLSRKEILYTARDKFFDDQKAILEKEHLTEDDYKKSLELSSRNLTEYIIFRQKQIDKLKKITGEDKEKIIHDMISPQKDADTQENFNIFRNNAWLLDDRFMTFSHSFSDLEISKITDIELFEQKSNSGTRPDFLMLFSKPLENDPEEVDIVIFEFKRLNLNIHRNFDATTELLKYTREIQKVCGKKTKVGRIWLYALVNMSDNFRETLNDTDFKQRFTVSGEVWYRYYETRNVEISYLDFDALVSDANTRNKTFMDILKDRFVVKSNYLS